MPFTPPSPDELVEETKFTPPSPDSLVQSFTPPSPDTIVSQPGGAYGTRFRPSLKGFPVNNLSDSAFGISPEMVPSGAGTKAPWLSIPASVVGKTAAGIGGYLTSPQGATEAALAATPAAPVILAKWAYDMMRGGYRSTKAIVDELGQMANEALNKGIISANQLGPIPEGKTTQEHIQSLSENAANAALMGLGAFGAASHIAVPRRTTPTVTETTPSVPAAEMPTTPTQTGLRPAIRLVGGKVVVGDAGSTHPDIIKSNNLTAEDIDQRGFVDEQGNFKDREQAAQQSGVPTASETARQHSTDLPEAKVSPAAVTEGTKPSEPLASKAGEGAVAAAPTAQAIPEANVTAPVAQAPSVTPGVTEPPVIQAGAAHVSEIPETGAGGEKYGGAARVVAERVKAGQIDPIEPGTGTSAKAQVLKYREIVQRDPEIGPRIMAQFEADPNKAISDYGMGVVRAHGEALAAGARTIEEHYGTESPEYNAAKNYLTDWDQRYQGMKTKWSEAGRGIQGETDIDTGSFTGLNRAYHETNERDIPKDQKPKAHKIAKENKQAQNDLRVASDTLKKAIRTKAVPNAEQAALDAASKTVRDAAAKLADAENKSRVAQTESDKQESDVQLTAARKALKAAQDQARDAAARLAKEQSRVKGQPKLDEQSKAAQKALDQANKTVRDAAAKLASQEAKSGVVEARRKKAVADVQVKAAQKALDTAKRVEDQARQRALKEAQRKADDPSIAVWELANQYLDENHGLYSFDDIRNKIATDLGMKPSKVTSLMAQDSHIKRLAVDMWNKQRNARRLKETAKMWLRELDTPGYQKALATIPRSMFSLAVFGHGFVALGTHAPIVAFQPRFWGAYVRNFGRMYKLVFSPAYYEAQMQDLVRRPNYDLARQAGLQNDPFQYEEYQTQEMKRLVGDWIGKKNMDRLGKLAGGGNRGYSVLKVLRQDMFDQMWDKLPKKIQAQKGVAEAIADGVNHATGVTKKGAHPAFAVALFAPRLEASRFMWLAGDTVRATAATLNWKKTTEGERQFAINYAKERAWVLGTFASMLAINQGILTAAGSEQKINGIPESLGGAGWDPLASDFLKFKAAGANIAYGGALLTMAKLPARAIEAILYEGKGSKYVLEDERLDKVVGSYLRTQASPFAGTVGDLAIGRDYQERPLQSKMFGTVEQTGKVPKRLVAEGIDEPYGWGEYAATHLPIPMAEAVKEVFRGMGMSDEQSKYWMNAMAIGMIMTGTGTRISEDTREK